MDLKVLIQDDMKAAMKERNSFKVDALRMLISEIKKREIDTRVALTTPEIYATINSLVKQRMDSVEAYTKGNRPELAEKETQEIALLKHYLPQAFSDAELTTLIQTEIQAVGATSPKDMGKVVKAVMAKAEGRADGKRVSQAVQAILSKPQ